jgi:hypothetical protein
VIVAKHEHCLLRFFFLFFFFFFFFFKYFFFLFVFFFSFFFFFTFVIKICWDRPFEPHVSRALLLARGSAC